MQAMKSMYIAAGSCDVFYLSHHYRVFVAEYCDGYQLAKDVKLLTRKQWNTGADPRRPWA